MSASLGHPTKIAPSNYHTPWAIVAPVIQNPFLHLGSFNPATFLFSFNHKPVLGEKTIVAEQDVAHYHATTLAADDEQALSAWLKASGYLSTPEIIAWLKPYADAKWKITAFKLIKNDNIDPARLTTGAIRLSFSTDRPFYPYSEPSNQQQSSAANPLGRALQLAILSDQRVTGALADHTSWPGKLEFAGPSNTSPIAGSPWTPRQWLAMANLDDAAHKITVPVELTTLIDESNPRPGTADLYFSPDTDQSPYQGAIVDLSITPQTGIVLSHSFSDIAAVLLMIVLPFAPLYCGWQVLKMEPRKVALRSSWELIIHRILGVYAIVLGCFYGTQFALMIMSHLLSAGLGWSTINGKWLWTLVALVLLAMPIAAMSWGAVYCGVNVWRPLTTAANPRRNSGLFQVDGGAWQGFMAASSLMIGAILLLALMSVLFPVLNL